MPTYSDLLKKAQKDWDCPTLSTSADNVGGQKIPFSSPLMNWATYGGIPRKAITEFHGAPGGGKTTTAVDICKNAIDLFEKEFEEEVADLRDKIAKGKKEFAGPLEDLLERGPKKVVYWDLEHSFDKKWSAKLGIDRSKIEILQPPNIPAEKILQMLEDMVSTGELGLTVLDSLPSLVTEAELGKKYGERTVSALAGLLAVFMRKITPVLSRNDCTLLMINQIRDNMDNPYVVNTPGGQAPKFYASLRILFRLGAPVDFLGNELPASTENPAGYLINAKLIKQKSAPFDRKLGSYFLMAQSGLRPDFDYAKLAVSKYGIIKKSGAWFTLCDPNTGEILENEQHMPIKLNGMAKVYDYLQSNQDYYNAVVKYITDDINGEEFDPEQDQTTLAEVPEDND